MVEAERPGILDPKRAAEAHRTKGAELGAALEEQAHELEVVLVPAHGDAVLREPAEAGHDPLVEPLADVGEALDRLEGSAGTLGGDTRELGRQRLELEAVECRDAMALVHEMVGEIAARGAQAHDEDLPPAQRSRHGPAQVERIPAPEQAVDLHPPGQREHVREDAGLAARDVDGLLALVDARLHAVVAHPVPGERTERIVDADHGKGAERMARGLEHVHLGDLLLERAAGEGDPEDAFAECSALLLLEALGAGILVLMMAPDAVVGVIQAERQIGTAVAQIEALAARRVAQVDAHDFVAALLLGHHRHEAIGIELVRYLEEHARTVALLARGTEDRPGGIAARQIEGGGISGLVLAPDHHLGGKGELVPAGPEMGVEGTGEGGTIEGRSRGFAVGARRLALHEEALAGVERRQPLVLGLEGSELGLDAEELGEKILEVRGEGDRKIAFGLGSQGIGVGARGHEPIEEGDVARLEPAAKKPVEGAAALARVECFEGEAVRQLETAHPCIP